MVLDSRYYVAIASDVDSYGQSDYLYLLIVNDFGLIGYAAEFDACTTDIDNACVPENSSRAKWFGWDENWQWSSAMLEEIKALNLDKYLIGSKKI